LWIIGRINLESEGQESQIVMTSRRSRPVALACFSCWGYSL
jgi:hypothetical protein